MPGTGASPQTGGQQSSGSCVLELLTPLPLRAVSSTPAPLEDLLTISLGLTITIPANPFSVLNLKCWGQHTSKDGGDSKDRDPLSLQYILYK